ncbi:hypothetical protein BGK49_14150 [Shigella sp. FC1544]|nr:hypothetical protein BGK49_14150 [Shigella sp. FC1544]ODQ20890.1 hypothetical protein BGK52_14455 [Shigella sp. FC1056]OEG49525.1 hypothetical protein BHQ36_14495 [Shigella sp. FC2531]OEG50184.1 hypothetical protein BHQ37_14825 [Shigella sp. FC2541]OEG53787.1 hypothetical protein BHQ39_14600 [Shigella sp. FC3196]OEJ04391.1 hypothetical protein BHE87_14480 [Shigella sp. FC1708]OEJ06483.1 hypothetical protein BHE88_14840 [Shigella sp. FC1737]
MLPSETMIWQPEFTDKTLSRKPGAVQLFINHFTCVLIDEVNLNDMFCDINANRCIFHLWSLQSEGALCIPYWAL